jgi:hypothetical protein
MRMILYSILCVSLSELAFLLGYLLAYGVYLVTDLALVGLVRRRLSRKIHASTAGIVCGALGGFCALSVGYAFSRLSGVAGPSVLILSMGLPAIGLFSYLGKSLRQVASGYFHTSPLHGRLHAAMMAIPQRAQFTLIKFMLEQGHPEPKGVEDDAFGQIAYRETTVYLCNMTILSFPGAIIGLFLSYWVFGR